MQFDPVGNRLTTAALINQMGLVGICLLAAALFYRIYSWNYVITPGKASRRYSVFIVGLALLMIGFTVLVNESVGIHIAESRGMPYVGLVHGFFVLLLHAWSYKVQSPFSVLASVSYVVAGITLGLVYVLVGWAAPTTAVGGGLVGTLIVSYVLSKSSTKIKRVLAVEEESINEQ